MPDLLGLRVGGLLGRQRLLDACAVLLVEMHIGRHRGLDEVALGVLVLLLCLAVGLFLRRLDLGKLLLGGHGARRARLLVARLVLGRQVLILFLALLVERLPLLAEPAHLLHRLGLRVGGLLGRELLAHARAVLAAVVHVGRHRGLDEVARCVLVLLLLGLRERGRGGVTGRGGPTGNGTSHVSGTGADLGLLQRRRASAIADECAWVFNVQERARRGVARGWLGFASGVLPLQHCGVALRA